LWVKLDDKLHSHPKRWEVSNAALGLHLLALSYCGDQLTDGRVPGRWASQQQDRQEISELCSAGFWTVDGESFVIHDFLEYNPSREQVLAEREAARARMQRHRNGKRSPEQRANGAGTHGEVQ
jgi:hypothetical protein